MSKSKRTKKVKQSNELAVVEHDPINEAKSLMNKMNDSAKSLRAQVYEFYERKMWLAFYSDSGLKGCRKCLKNYIKPDTYSSVCRYLQVAVVEVELQIKQGSMSLTVLLMYFKYRKEDWHTIFEELPKNPNKKIFEIICDELLARGKIEKVKPAKKSEPVDNLKTAKKLLNILTPDELDELYESIVKAINQLF